MQVLLAWNLDYHVSRNTSLVARFDTIRNVETPGNDPLKSPYWANISRETVDIRTRDKGLLAEGKYVNNNKNNGNSAILYMHTHTF